MYELGAYIGFYIGLFLFFAVTIVLGVVFVRATDVPLSRRDYVIRVLVGFGALVVSNLVIKTILDETTSFQIWLLAWLLLVAVDWLYLAGMCRWAARRFLDLEKSKWLGFLIWIPLVGLLMVVALCFLRSRLPAQTAVPN